MKKNKIFIISLIILTLIAFYIMFMVGRYSYLITQPEIFLSQDDKWAVKKAREYAVSNGISEKRLKNPKIRQVVMVYFGGIPNTTGKNKVIVTIDKNTGDFIECQY